MIKICVIVIVYMKIKKLVMDVESLLEFHFPAKNLNVINAEIFYLYQILSENVVQNAVMNMGSKERKCTKCNKIKPLDFFDNKHDGKYGKSSYCKECRKIKDYNYSKNNKEKIAKRQKEYRKNNREHLDEYQKKYRKKNKEILAIKDKKYKEKNKDHYKKQKKAHYEKNRNKYIALAKEYRKKNKKLIRKKLNQYEKNKIKNDLNSRLRKTLKNRLLEFLKNGKGKRKSKTTELLGCTIQEFKNHLESLFESGMTWKNYGINGWHMDHILPCSAFDLTNSEEQEICFHYTNIQPLWAEENIKKGNKIL